MVNPTVASRARFGVVIPMTNVVCEADYPRLAVEGVAFHYGRAEFSVPRFETDDAFDALIRSIHEGSTAAIERIMSTSPDYMICGMSAETFWGGVEGNRAFTEEVRDLSGGIGVTTGATATAEALKLYGAKKIGVLCPYPAIGVGHVRDFFTGSGFDVLDVHGFPSDTPEAMWHLGDDDFRPVIDSFLEREVDAVVQVGTNVSMLEYSAAVERHVGVPVVPINGACVWHAYRAMGINDQFTGHGRLFEDL